MRENQRKTKGQQLKGKIVSEIFTLFQSFFFTLFQNFPPGTFVFKTKGFSSMRTKEKKRYQKEQDKSMLHVSCCTFVLLLEKRERDVKVQDPKVPFPCESADPPQGSADPQNRAKRVSGSKKLRFPVAPEKGAFNQRKTSKRATTKGQNRFIIFRTFSHFFTLFHNFSPRDFPFKTKGFSSMRTKEKKR